MIGEKEEKRGRGETKVEEGEEKEEKEGGEKEEVYESSNREVINVVEEEE